jgi:TolB-like protein
MKNLYLLLCMSFVAFNAGGQITKIAILDFENVSGNPKYSGLGKAMSSMLISDIESNTSKQKIQLVERGQIQKILKEQNFQSSKLVDKASTVKTGKILGVKYMLIGEIFILNDQLIINARLTNTETGEITFSNKQEGKLVSWLSLKTNIAKDIASKLNFPLISKSLNSSSISENSLLLYANGIGFLDKNEIDSANRVLTELKYTEKEFNYTNNELEKLYDLATKQTSNNKLKQKAYILNLHKRISANPVEAWQQIELFWNGSLDEKYPYLEYLFLKNLYEKFKNDSKWLNYPISRRGANAKLGDMILFSISNHASHANEIKTAINYNQIRESKFPSSELSIIWGEPIHPSKYRWQLLDEVNKDTIYYKYLSYAQQATIMGLGTRNFKIMREYFEGLMPLLDFPFYDFIPSEYYYELADKARLPIFNPYDVIGTLMVLIGTENEKLKCQEFFKKNKERQIYMSTIKEMSWYNNNLEYNMLLRNASIWASSSFEDYTDKKWTDLDFTYDNGIHVVTIDAICLQTSLKNNESFEMMKKLMEYLEKNPKFYKEKLWLNRTVQEVCYIIQFRNCIRLGKIEDVKHFSRQMALIGIDPYEYSALHTELFDEL